MANFKDTLDLISRKKWGPILGTVIAFVVAYLLLVYVSPRLMCFGTLIVALPLYFIPYYLGLKKTKMLAVWGVIFIILLPIPYTATLVDTSYEYGDKGYTASSSDGTLVNGVVTPYTDSDNDVYTFTVDADEKYDEVLLRLVNVYNSTEYSSYVMNYESDAEDGKKTYSHTSTLDTGYYQYYFEGIINDENSGNELEKVNTGALAGPINDTESGLFIKMLQSAYVSIGLYVGLIYFLLLYLMYSNRRNREILEQRRAQNQPKEGPDGTFFCPKCNTEIVKGQRFCPQCGENFFVDPVEAKVATAPFKGADDDYFCTECGTKVDEDAKICPGCGKKFE